MRIHVVLLWIPRMLAMALALFLAMFAMDVFVEGKDYAETIGDFVIHLIPSFCVVVVLVIGWRRDGLAALGFLALAVAYFIALSGWRHPAESFLLTLPPVGVSLAFYARMRLMEPHRPRSE